MTAQTQVSVAEPPARLAVAVPLDTQWRVFRWVLIAADAIALVISFGVAYSLRFHLDLSLAERLITPNPPFYTGMATVLVPVWLLVFLAAGLYDEHKLLGGTKEYALVFTGVSAGMLLVVVATFLSPGLIIARGWLLYSWVTAAFLVAAFRFTIRRVVYRLRGRGYFLAPTLIVGDNAESVSLAQQLVAWRSSGLDVLGFATREPRAGRVYGNLSSLGTYADVGDMVRRLDVREVVVATSALDREELVELFRELAPIPDVELRLSGGLFEIMTTGLSIKEVAFVPLVTVHPSRLKGIDLLLKTTLDYAVALSCVVLGGILYMAIALAVKLDSRGPVFHRREVLGQGGRRFRCYKFRTMVHDAEDFLKRHPELAAQFDEKHKLEHDPRVTRLGRFLRKSSLDELPQMFNVLLGDMSVVGPRMISPAEHARYGKWDMNLLTLKPGITGLWQVSGRSETSYDERVQLDMNYVRNWSIWLDLQILFQTIPAVLKGRGAY
jgi:exopolysaccharide biosynthesis polyprenyl glycosylphosphotransferase